MKTFQSKPSIGVKVMRANESILSKREEWVFCFSFAEEGQGCHTIV